MLTGISNIVLYFFSAPVFLFVVGNIIAVLIASLSSIFSVKKAVVTKTKEVTYTADVIIAPPKEEEY